MNAGGTSRSTGHDADRPRPTIWWTSRQPLARSCRNSGCHQRGVEVARHHGRPSGVDERQDGQVVGPLAVVDDRALRVHDDDAHRAGRDRRRRRRRCGAGWPVGRRGRRVAAPQGGAGGEGGGHLDPVRVRRGHRASPQDTGVVRRVLAEREHVGVESARACRRRRRSGCCRTAGWRGRSTAAGLGRRATLPPAHRRGARSTRCRRGDGAGGDAPTAAGRASRRRGRAEARGSSPTASATGRRWRGAPARAGSTGARR